MGEQSPESTLETEAMAKQSQPNPRCQKHCAGRVGLPTKVLLPPLQIKMGLTDQFVEDLQSDGNCFKYLCSTFPGLSEAKLKGIFVGTDIRKLIPDEMFETTMSNVESEAWIALKDVLSISFLNYRDHKYKNIERCRNSKHSKN
jgi:hypothetical protein